MRTARSVKLEIAFTGDGNERGTELLALWRRSLSQVIGVKVDARSEVVNEHLEFLRSLNPGFTQAALEETGHKLVGFMRLERQVP